MPVAGDESLDEIVEELAEDATSQDWQVFMREGEIRDPNFGTSELTLDELKKKIRQDFDEQNLTPTEIGNYESVLNKEIRELRASIVRLKKELEQNQDRKGEKLTDLQRESREKSIQRAAEIQQTRWIRPMRGRGCWQRRKDWSFYKLNKAIRRIGAGKGEVPLDGLVLGVS